MNKHIKITFTIVLLNLLFHGFSFSQDQKTIIVKGADGNPVAGANVIIGEDAKPIITNEKGEFSLNAGIAASILIDAEGFEPHLMRYAPGTVLDEVNLIQMPFHMSERDGVDIPFGHVNKRQITGAITAVNPDEILLYDYQRSVNGLLNGRVPGLFGSSNIRGIGGPLYVIDGIVRPVVNLMNVHGIKQISVLKDMSTAMLYGPQALNGVVFITTKRGEPLRNSLRFTAESGIDNPISYPNYLSAVDYMELFNEARDNDGLSTRYTDEAINNTRSRTNPLRYPDEHYYNSTYLGDWASYHRINSEISGGNEMAQFFVNIGWDRSNSLLTLGEGANEKSDRLNFRGNIDYDITDIIKLTFDGAVIFNFSTGPRYTNANNDFWNLSTTLRPEIYPVAIPVDLLDDEFLRDAARPEGNFIFGGTSEYQTNIYGELTKNGSRASTDRLLGMNTGLDFDLGGITPGLKSKFYFSFDMYNQYREDLLNSYAVYRPVFGEGDIIDSWAKYKSDQRVTTKTVGGSFYYRRYGTYGSLDYGRVFGDHQITATALMYGDLLDYNRVQQHQKHLHFGGRVNYMFQNKYIAQLTAVHAGSLKLFEAKRWAFSPGIGLGWILTEEDFLTDNNVLDYLKIRANWAILQTDENLLYRLDRNYYTSSSSYTWDQGSYSNSGRNIFYGNPDLGWEKIMNYSVGFESMLLDYKLGFEASYFYNKYYDQITRRTNTLPDYFGNLPYENYGSNQTQGVEMGLNYSFSIGDLSARMGGNFAYSVPKLLIVDELDFEDEYRKRAGIATDGRFGLIAIGFFRDQADIDNSPTQEFGPVQPGDIKYKDMNGDGLINDDDISMIGNAQARFDFGFNLKLDYKSFTLFALATGQTGQDRYFNNSFYWVFGERKYSEVVLDRWTPATAETATYPRLSSTSSANNFRPSTFWLYQTDWFSLRTLQLTYILPSTDFGGLEEARVFFRGSNLFMISEEKDKLQLNVGSQPQMRSFALGLNVKF